MRDTYLSAVIIIVALFAWVSYADAQPADTPPDSVPGLSLPVQGHFIVDTVIIVRKNVVDTTGMFPWARKIVNSLHIVTKESVIADELLAHNGDTASQHTLDQMEENLRDLGVFSDILFEVIPVTAEETEKEYPHVIVKVITRDGWSSRVYLSFNSSAGIHSYGARLEEINFLGYSQHFSVGADYTTLNDRGWRGTAFFREPNLWGTHMQLVTEASHSKFTTSGGIAFGKPYYADRSEFAFGTGASYLNGKEFFYFQRIDDTPQNPYVSIPIETERTQASGWISSSNGKDDVFRSSASLSFNRTVRDTLPPTEWAFSNSIQAFVGISSLRRRFERMSHIEFTGKSLVPIGAQGRVSIGKISPHNGGRDNIIYVGGEARKSIKEGPLYAFASVEGGTGFSGKETKFTLERVTASAALELGPGVIATRVQQSTVWNWPRYVFQSLDSDNGLRGYPLFRFIGDNRLTWNLEYRILPLVDLYFFDLGTVAFYDVAGVWNQGQEFGATRFHSGAGIGLRFGSASSIDIGLLRVDLAYNFNEGKIGEVIISTSEAFDVFGTLEYRPPGPYVP